MRFLVSQVKKTNINTEEKRMHVTLKIVCLTTRFLYVLVFIYPILCCLTAGLRHPPHLYRSSCPTPLVTRPRGIDPRCPILSKSNIALRTTFYKPTIFYKKSNCLFCDLIYKFCTTSYNIICMVFIIQSILSYLYLFKHSTWLTCWSSS